MKKNLLLYILLVFLVVMNGFFLIKHFGATDQKGLQRKGPRNFIAKQLKFDEAQTAQFEKLDAEHHEKIRAILDDLKESKDALFDELSNEIISNVLVDSLTNVIGKKQTLRELETFNFFKAVRELCDQDQKNHFEEIIKDAVRGPGGHNGNGPPGGPGGERRPPPRH